MNLTNLERKEFEACKQADFVQLDWTEGISDISGKYQHYSIIHGNSFNIYIHVEVENLDVNKYVVNMGFCYFLNRVENVVCRVPLHEESDLESAITYAQWKATLICRMFKHSFNENILIPDKKD